MNHNASIEVPLDCRLEMAAHARDDFPRECCGILLGQRSNGCVCVERIVQTRNITAGDPHTSYQVDWKTLLDTRRLLRSAVSPGATSIVGFYHSHTDGTSAPSRFDLEFAWAEHYYLIVPVDRGEVGRAAAWFARGGSAGFTLCLDARVAAT